MFKKHYDKHRQQKDGRNKAFNERREENPESIKVQKVKHLKN